ncbi:MAG: restriction alleviation protein, Lar family [Ramlibacter sp.]|nr:restriction alleviation protein, Lar family [Ramlibacter sp.]
MTEASLLLPCPFCGGEAEFERTGTPRRSCIVACRMCGARHESSDENERSGASWNTRHFPSETVSADVVLVPDAVSDEKLEERAGMYLATPSERRAYLAGLKACRKLLSSGSDGKGRAAT